MTAIINDYLNLAHKLCDHAAMTTRQFFRQSIDVEKKADASPVTIADKKTEVILRHLINQQYPEHAIIGEEHGVSGESDWQWVIDPIDGTRSFISGFPVYACLVALLYRGQPMLSIIDMPILGERFVACEHGRTTLNGRTIGSSNLSVLNQAKLYSTDPIMFNPSQIQQHQALAQASALVRYSGDGYLYGMLAAGWIDLVLEADLQPYDFLPLTLIVERAGGVITDWQGRPLTPDSKGEVLASANQILHQQAIDCLHQIKK